MKIFVARVQCFFDSPSLPRDIASMLSAWRIGVWFLVLNIGLGGFLGLMIYSASVVGLTVSKAASELGLGQYLACMLLLGITVLLTFMMPLRAAGLFEGARWGRYFDQIVLSGISPGRLFAGKILAQNIFFFLILAATLPYAIFCTSLDGTHYDYVCKGLFLLWLYANLLTVTTLALIPFVHESIAVFGTIVFFFFAGIIAWLPFPPVAGVVSPVHFLLSPLWDILFNLKPNQGVFPYSFSVLPVSLWGYDFELTSFTFCLLGYLFAGGIAVVVMLLGPINCLVRSHSTFGEVVFRGDCKRKSIFRFRFTQQRRAEVSFFYENRSPWLTRWEAPLRYGSLLAGFAVLVAISFGVLHYVTTLGISSSDFADINLAIFCGGMALAAIIFCGDKAIEAAPLQFGKKRAFTTGHLDAFGFAVCVLLLVIAAIYIPSLREWLEGKTWLKPSRWRSSSWGHYYQLKSLYPFLALLGIQFYLILRWFSLRLLNRVSAVFGAVGFSGIFWVGPVLLMQMLLVFAPRETIWETLAQSTAIFSIVPYLLAMRGDKYFVREMGATADLINLTVPIYILMTIGVLILVVRRHRVLVKERAGLSSVEMLADEKAASATTKSENDDQAAAKKGETA